MRKSLLAGIVALALSLPALAQMLQGASFLGVPIMGATQQTILAAIASNKGMREYTNQNRFTFPPGVFPAGIRHATVEFASSGALAWIRADVPGLTSSESESVRKQRYDSLLETLSRRYGQARSFQIEVAGHGLQPQFEWTLPDGSAVTLQQLGGLSGMRLTYMNVPVTRGVTESLRQERANRL